MRIVLTGGGTGGHIFPLIAVAKKLKEIEKLDTEFLFVGSSGKLEKETMTAEGIPCKFIASGKMRRYFSFLNFLDFFKVPIGIIKSLWILLVFMPDAVFSKGGHASLPVTLAAWIYRIPVLIHESDAIPGVANRIAEKFSKRVAISYPLARNYFPVSKVVLTGNPIREGILSGNLADARKRFGLTDSKPTILIMGGSQGSQLINKAIIQILPDLIQHTQIIHQTGEENLEEVSQMAAQQGIKVGRDGYLAFSFLQAEETRDALVAADLVISRAGANSIAEIAATRKPAILIPLASAANDHQRMNAFELAKIGGAMVLEEKNLTKSMMLSDIKKLLADKELQSSMSSKIGVFYHPDAAEKIADGIIELTR